MASKTKVQLILEAKDQASKSFKSATKSMDNLKVGMGLGAAAAVAMSAAIIAAAEKTASAYASMVDHMADVGDQFDKMSARTGLAVESLDRLNYVAALNGSSIENVEKGIRKLSVSMYDAKRGSAEYVDAFSDLGVTVTDSNGQMRDTEDVLVDLADAFNGIASDTERTALAQKLLGRSGAELLPMLKNGSAAMREQMGELDKLGGAMSGKFATSSAGFVDAQLRMTTAWGSFKREITGPALDVAAVAIDSLAESLGGAGSAASGSAREMEKSFASMIIVAAAATEHALAMVEAMSLIDPTGRIPAGIREARAAIRRMNEDIAEDQRDKNWWHNLDPAVLDGMLNKVRGQFDTAMAAVGEITDQELTSAIRDLNKEMAELGYSAAENEIRDLLQQYLGLLEGEKSARAAARRETEAQTEAVKELNAAAAEGQDFSPQDMFRARVSAMNAMRGFGSSFRGGEDEIVPAKKFAELESNMKGVERESSQLADAAAQMGRAFEYAFADIVLGAESAVDALKSVLNQAARIAIHLGLRSLAAYVTAGGSEAVLSGPMAAGSIVAGGGVAVDKSAFSGAGHVLSGLDSGPMSAPSFGGGGGGNITIAPVLLGNLTKSQQRQAGVMLLDAYDTAKRERL